MSLSELEKEIIDKNLYSFEHNWKIDTYLFGEPFYKNGILYYQSNKDISICFYPLIEDNLNEIYSFIKEVSAKIDEKELSSLKIYGSKHQLLKIKKIIQNKNLIFEYESDIDNYEYMINTTTYTSTALRCYKKAKKIGYTYKINNEKYLNIAHIELIQTYMKIDNMHNIDILYFSLIPALIKRNDIIILDVYSDNILIGFSIFHHFSKKTYFQLYNISLKNIPYVHDYFLGTFLNNYMQNNENLYIGAGNTTGLKQFKKKWGKELKSDNIATLVHTNKMSTYPYYQGIWWAKMIYKWSIKNNPQSN